MHLGTRPRYFVINSLWYNMNIFEFIGDDFH